MVFSSISFIFIFLPAVLRILSGSKAIKNLVLLVFSTSVLLSIVEQ